MHTILVIEDDKDIMSLITELLQAEGYNVLSAYNGLEGLEKLKNMSVLPNLILLDLMMPKMDGFAFREEQQKDPQLKKIPVIIMSADGKAEEKLKTTGALTHLKKPFSELETILNPIAKALQSRDS